MIGILPDTNVISELSKSRPEPRVVTFLSAQPHLWISAIVIHELEYGVYCMPQGRERDRLSAFYQDLIDHHSSRILPVERSDAEWAARFRANARRSGRPLDMGDALIAGTAKSHNLVVATRNVADFDHLDVELLNPWNSP